MLMAVAVMACTAQKPLGVTFTESGKGVGIFSGLVEKTATTAPATIASTVDTANEAVTLLEFTVKENGSKDSYPLQIKELRFTTSGTADIADLRFLLDGPGLNNAIGTSSGTTVTFKDFGDLIVSDGDQTGKTFQLKVHLRTNIQGSLADNTTVAVNISPLTGMDVTETSSNILQNVVSMQANSSTIQIAATELQGKGTFSFSNIGTGVAFPGTPVIHATDVNGRTDKDYVTSVTLVARMTDCTSAQAGLASSDGGGLTHTPVQGIASWTNISFGVAATTFKVYATSGSLTPLCTAAITTP